MRAGFPHSDISGSKPVCGLPGAFRTLRRPSSPVIAKASTACTCSLDPITPSALRLGAGRKELQDEQRVELRPHAELRRTSDFDAIINPCVRLDDEHTSRFLQIVKERTATTREESRLRATTRCALVIPRWKLVELIGFEPTTPCLQSRCSPS